MTARPEDRMRLSRLGCAMICLAVAACSPAAPAETGPAPGPAAEESTGAASFTAEQVDRGRTEFGVVCAECHASSEFRGRTFQFEWRRRTAWDFYRNITDTMPEDAPGSLTDQQYVDIIAYILEMNGFAPGEYELQATEAALDGFVMDGAPTP